MRPMIKRQNDLQRAHAIGECTSCGAELYPSSRCWRLSGHVLCESCAAAWLLSELAPFCMSGEEIRQ